MSIDFQTPVSIEKINTYTCKDCDTEFEADEFNQCVICQDVFCDICISDLSICQNCDMEADN